MLHINDSGTEIHYRSSYLQYLVSQLIVILSQLLIIFDIKGLENIPEQGPFIVAGNHLHLFDGALCFIIIPKHMTFFVKRKMRRPPFTWLLACMGDVIYIDVGKFDRQAFLQAQLILQSHGVLVMAPEGSISRTRGLIKGQTGTARLATRTNTPILPIAIYGQERAINYWAKFRKVPISVRIGPLIKLPTGKINKEQLPEHTEYIMLTLARLLPTEYRGVYAEIAINSDQEN